MRVYRTAYVNEFNRNLIILNITRRTLKFKLQLNNIFYATL